MSASVKVYILTPRIIRYMAVVPPARCINATMHGQTDVSSDYVLMKICLSGKLRRESRRRFIPTDS